MTKTLLVTGGSGGIGQAICREFAAEGYDIVIHYCSSEASAESLAKNLREAFGVKAVTVKADLRKGEEVKLLAEKALALNGSVDVLINNAGVAYFSLFQQASEEKIKEVFDINLMSAMALTKELIPEMIARRKGTVLNISSMWGIHGASCEVHYSASKAALAGFTGALAKEVGPSGITVNCIAPGFIDTKMNSCLDEESVRQLIEDTPVMRKGEPEDVAALAAFLASDRAGFITGQVISVDGGYGI